MTHKQFIPAFFSQDAFKDFDKFFLGFDDQFEKMQALHDDLTKNIPNYPPFNVRKNGNTYTIEIAEVKDAEMFNGMLKIALDKLVPEEKKAKKVPVKTGTGKQFLND